MEEAGGRLMGGQGAGRKCVAALWLHNPKTSKTQASCDFSMHSGLGREELISAAFPGSLTSCVLLVEADLRPGRQTDGSCCVCPPQTGWTRPAASPVLQSHGCTQTQRFIPWKCRVDVTDGEQRMTQQPSFSPPPPQTHQPSAIPGG